MRKLVTHKNITHFYFNKHNIRFDRYVCIYTYQVPTYINFFF